MTATRDRLRARTWLLVLEVTVAFALGLVVLGAEISRFAGGDRGYGPVIAVGVGVLIAGIAVTGFFVVRASLGTDLSSDDDRCDDDVVSPDEWLWETDRRLRLTYCSPAATEVLGYPAERGRS